MARSSDKLVAAAAEEEEEEEVEEIWGTWEELLLACAVNRHGVHSWDSVASEVRSRSPYADLLTADNCRRRYRLLRRRFSDDGISDGGDEIDGEEAPEPTAVEIPWLDELRKLRVAELRREVQRYDVSIGSLQLKVKKLKEERERSLRESEAEAGDDAANGSGSRSGSDPKESNDPQRDRAKSPPDKASGEDSGRSCKESNSTEPKAEEVRIAERIKEEPDPAVNGSRSGSRSDPVAGAAASYNGSSDTIAKGTARFLAAEPNPTRNESGESVAESKGGDVEEEGTKESSDVQSSASLSRGRRGGRRRRASAAAEPEAEAQSPARKAVYVESRPLIAFFETIRSNKDGSVFEHRLESQESVEYRGLIRRHVDLEMVRKRIGRNGYTSAEFFRDLLLLCNNALVFYPKNSPESISAAHLRYLINKEIAATLKTPLPPPQSVKEPTPPPAATAQPPLSPAAKSSPDPDRGSAPLEKPAPLPPLMACRKRSSISGKPAKPVKRVEKEEAAEKEEESEEEGEERVVEKKSTKQQRTAVSRGLRTNKTRSNSKGGGGSVAKTSNPVSAPKPEPAEQETKSGGGGGATAKKKSAADFLNRMKSSSPPSSNGKLVESLKSSSGTRRGGGGEQKRKPSSKEESKKESVSATKRSVGRPPKRAAAPPAKRPREEKTPPLPKKRGRR